MGGTPHRRPVAGRPGQHGDREGARVAGADVVGQPHRLIRVGAGVHQAALPQGDERAKPEGLGQQGDGAAIACEDDRAVEVAPGADPVPEEDGAAAGLLDLFDDVDVVGGLTLDRAREVAATGVDFISVGALTHSVIVFDLGMDLQEDPA